MLKKSQIHLHHVEESYWRHLGFAVRFGARMVVGGLGAVLHGIIPAFFQTTASRTVAALHEDMQARLTAKTRPGL